MNFTNNLCYLCKRRTENCSPDDINNCPEYEFDERSRDRLLEKICLTCINQWQDCIPNTKDDCVNYQPISNRNGNVRTDRQPDPPIIITTGSTEDKVNHPSHYTQGGIECIDAIKASMSAEGFQDYCKGNVIKYIWRWRNKGGVEDLKKASVYLFWLIESAEEGSKEEA